jgi:excisionase family DNA binding protein
MSSTPRPRAAQFGPLDGTLRLIVQEIVREVIDELRPLLVETVEHSRAPQLATGQQMADLLHVSRATLDRYVNKGHLPYVRLGPDGPRRFRVEDVLASFSSHREPPGQTPRETTFHPKDDHVRLLRRGKRTTG